MRDNKETFTKIFGQPGNQVLERIRAYSPRLTDHVYDYIAADLYAGPALSVRDRELCVISSLASQGGLSEQLTVHIKTARRNGVTRAEIIETIETVGSYAGIPRALNALFTAIEIFEAEQAN